MAFSKFAWLKAVEKFRLTATEHTVLMHVHNKADGSTGEDAYVTDDGMAEVVGCTSRSVQRATKRLRDLGLIERQKRGVKGVSGSTYRLTMPPDQPDIPAVSTRHSQPDIDRQPDIPVGVNPTPVSGISDPFTRSPKPGSAD